MPRQVSGPCEPSSSEVLVGPLLSPLHGSTWAAKITPDGNELSGVEFGRSSDGRSDITVLVCTFLLTARLMPADTNGAFSDTVDGNCGQRFSDIGSSLASQSPGESVHDYWSARQCAESPARRHNMSILDRQADPAVSRHARLIPLNEQDLQIGPPRAHADPLPGIPQHVEATQLEC